MPSALSVEAFINDDRTVQGDQVIVGEQTLTVFTNTARKSALIVLTQETHFVPADVQFAIGYQLSTKYPRLVEPAFAWVKPEFQGQFMSDIIRDYAETLFNARGTVMDLSADGFRTRKNLAHDTDVLYDYTTSRRIDAWSWTSDNRIKVEGQQPAGKVMLVSWKTLPDPIPMMLTRVVSDNINMLTPTA